MNDKDQRRGEPVGEIQCRIYHDTEQHRDYLKARFHPDSWKNRVSFEWQGHRWAYRYTHFDDSGEYDLIARSAPPSGEPVRGEPVTGEHFQRAWINLDRLPSTMMVGPEGRFGPVPGSTSCWITTSENEMERLKATGPVLEVWTAPQPAEPARDTRVTTSVEHGVDTPD